MTSNDSYDQYGREIFTKLASYGQIRQQRYAAANVLLMSWEDDDTNSTTEIEQLRTLLQTSFNYNVLYYLIPSTDSQTALNCRIGSFLHAFGLPDNLLIFYYGGHGGPINEKKKSPCTWAARIDTASASLDWSLIQPSLLNVPCDIAIILDCCYAGQAARSVSAQTIEILAATDKDQWTPNNKSIYPTFTQALIKEMKEMLEQDKIVTLRSLAKKLSAVEAGLIRQPFHVSLGSDHLAGPIKLAKLPKLGDTRTQTGEVDPKASLQLKLSLFEPLSSETASSLIRWMTRDSPTSISDIQYADNALAEASKMGQLCNSLLDVSSQADNQPWSYLSKQGQAEGLTLLSHLRDAISSPTSNDLTDIEAIQIIETVKRRSQDLVVFIEDSFSCLPKSSVQALGSGQLSKRVNGELRTRLNLRLTLIAENAPDLEMGIAFDASDPPRDSQRFRMGWKDDKRVLIEYFYRDETDKASETWLLQQMKRICALHAEEKSRSFHTMQGVGFLRESIYGTRYGIAYWTPTETRNHPSSPLSDLISKVKSVPLETRMATAYALCEALLNLHSIGWYHKAIKSGNVLVFGQDTETNSGALAKAWDLHHPYIVGFDCSRPSAAESRGTVDFLSSNNLYRHPDRWGRPSPYHRHHDIYALVSATVIISTNLHELGGLGKLITTKGILLLEVGCWRMLKKMDSKGKDFEHIKNPEHLRALLLGSILERATHAAGTRFASAVGFCLEERAWTDLEEWQVQKIMRQRVLEPLRLCFS